MANQPPAPVLDLLDRIHFPKPRMFDGRSVVWSFKAASGPPTKKEGQALFKAKTAVRAATFNGFVYTGVASTVAPELPGSVVSWRDDAGFELRETIYRRAFGTADDSCKLELLLPPVT